LVKLVEGGVVPQKTTRLLVGEADFWYPENGIYGAILLGGLDIGLVTLAAVYRYMSYE
jgi:hypothetical protein